jgi:hypothetical protein
MGASIEGRPLDGDRTAVAEGFRPSVGPMMVVQNESIRFFCCRERLDRLQMVLARPPSPMSGGRRAPDAGRTAMRRTRTATVPWQTPPDLVEAATRGARFAARRRREDGQDDATIRREVVARFRVAFGDDGCGELWRETLTAAVQRGVEQALGESRRN